MRSIAALTLLLAGCRFGGPGGDALALVNPPSDAGADAGGSEPERDSAAMPTPEPDAALPLPDASAADASLPVEAGACESPLLLVCDPVHDTGCTAGLTQCVVDPEASAPSGRCVFSQLLVTTCEESALATSCPPRHGCVAGACRKYCFCDADCGQDETCSELVGGGARGVRFCASSVD